MFLVGLVFVGVTVLGRNSVSPPRFELNRFADHRIGLETVSLSRMDHLGARLNFRPVQPRSPSFWFLGFLLYLGLLWTRTCLPRLHTLRQRRSPRPNNLLSNDPLF